MTETLNSAERLNVKLSQVLSGECDTKAQIEVVETDSRFGLQKIAWENHSLWVREEHLGKHAGIEYIIAEHDWMHRQSPDNAVRAGDVVLDVGAHVGIFVLKALELGDEKVVAIEPDPMNVECLRRNFASEIETGRVVVIPEGAWHESGTMVLNLGDSSGWNSMIWKHKEGIPSVEVPVRKFDEMFEELKLVRVDYIKMDIEGAERNALQGALEYSPCPPSELMIDTYHRPDDEIVLPNIILEGNGDYEAICDRCEPTQDGGRLVPHVTFYRTRQKS